MAKDYTIREIKYAINKIKNKTAECPMVKLNVCGNEVRHIIDTGTTLNIISRKDYNNINNKPNLQPTSITAFGFQATAPVPIEGEFITTLQFQDKSIIARYLVLKGEADNLLGFAAAANLGIIKLHHSIRHLTSFKESMMIKYPRVFENRIGKIPRQME